MAEVQIISAPWCKRCQTIKPDVAETCQRCSATLTYVEYEEMDDEEKAAIASLPTIRMRASATTEWLTYTVTTLEAWKSDMAAIAVATAVVDF